MAKKSTSKKPEAADDGEGRIDPKEIQKILDVPIEDRQIATMFESRPMSVENQHRAERIRRAGQAFAQVIKDNTDGGEAQKDAIRHANLASMLGVQAVSLMR